MCSDVRADHVHTNSFRGYSHNADVPPPVIPPWRRHMLMGLRPSLVALAVLIAVSIVDAETTVSFQQGVDGYVGTTDIYIGLDEADIPGGGDGNVSGATVEEMFLDGRYFAERGDEQEMQGLLRFDDIIGNGTGQIPSGAQVLSATLTLTTGTGSDFADSGGPYGVAQLVVPFDTTTTWNSLGGSGATFVNGQNKRPLDQGHRGPLEPGMTSTANVTQMVQNWIDGPTNNGLVVRAGTTNGWQIFTTGAADATLRPALEVVYDMPTTGPTATKVLQQGPSYSGTTMAWLQQNDTTTDGNALDEEFLDGPNDDGSSPDDQALIKFEGIFASEGGPVPDNAQITAAVLLVDTAGAARSASAGTNGNYAAHQALVDWDLTTLYSDFGPNGPTEADGELGPTLDLTGAVIADAQASLDVTDAVQAWQSGTPNYGFNIQAVKPQDDPDLGTSDGWAISWLASASPPQLAVSFVVPEPGTLALLALAIAVMAVYGPLRRRTA
jgi:hypothetical protein